MIKNLFGLIAIVLLASCNQDKIGFVNHVKLMDGYKEKSEIEERYKQRSESFGRKRDSISQSFQQQAQEFQTRAEKMSQSKAKEEYGQLQQRGQQIGQQLQMEEQQMQLAGQTEMDSLISKVKKEITAYGKDNNYTFILGGGEGGSVLYGDDAKDLTDEILQILNDKYSE